jgi:hypothetical protein
MQERLAGWLLDVHALLNDRGRERGAPPGAALEMDIERLASLRWMPTERRIRRGAMGGTYYSGLTPETDLFAYVRPEFLQTEVKDYSCVIGRPVVAELFARALDLHLGRARRMHPDSAWDHYVALIAAGGADTALRVACLRFGLCLVEPRLIPLPILARCLLILAPQLVEAGCPQPALHTACLPFNRRFPLDHGTVSLDASTLHSDRVVQSLLRFQYLGTDALRQRSRRSGDVS